MNIIEKNKEKIGIVIMLCILVVVLVIVPIFILDIPIIRLLIVYAACIALFLLVTFLNWCFMDEP